MYIDDTPNISAMELRTKARRLQAESRARPRHRRLPPADAGDHHEPRRQPRPGGVRDLARAQGARPRAVDPGHRALAAVAPAGDARVEGAAAVGPARVGRDRAGRGPRDVPVAREGTRRRTTRSRTARSSTSSSPSTATARPARSSSGSRRSRPASSATPRSATQRPASSATRGGALDHRCVRWAGPPVAHARRVRSLLAPRRLRLGALAPDSRFDVRARRLLVSSGRSGRSESE